MDSAEPKIINIMVAMRDDYRRARRAPMYFPINDVMRRFDGDCCEFAHAVATLCDDGKISRHRSINTDLLKLEI